MMNQRIVSFDIKIVRYLWICRGILAGLDDTVGANLVFALET